MEFFSITVKLPNDFAEEVPGMPAAILEELHAVFRPLPEFSDMDHAQIAEPYVELAERVVNQIRLEWDVRTDEPYLYFAQLEEGKHAYHVHVLLQTMGTKGFVFGRFVPCFKRRIVAGVYGGREPLTQNWFRVRKTKNVGGANQTVDEGYILNYLLPKVQPELQWAWSNIGKYLPALCNLAERKRLVDEHNAEVRAEREQRIASGEFDPLRQGTNQQRYMALVQWLVDHGITTEKQWIQEDQENYISHHATTNGRAQIKAALDNAAKIMLLTKVAHDYLIGRDTPRRIDNNRIFQIFRMNAYDPLLVANIFLGWAKRQFGKRNAIWLYGPATTGKTNVAEAIAHAVPYYGCVNWTNENFPFNDCVDKMIIWWEEGKMTAKIVEAAKAILGGSKVRVDQKCKASQQIDGTPVLITSNTDMTMVVDGNQMTAEHRQPLEDRMFQFVLGKRLPDNFGKITKQEVQDFFKWAELNPLPVKPCFLVPTESYKRAASGPASALAEVTATEEDACESSPKRSRYAGDESGAEYDRLIRTLAQQAPAPCVVHDEMERGECRHGRFLFCNECLECADQNKEQ